MHKLFLNNLKFFKNLLSLDNLICYILYSIAQDELEIFFYFPNNKFYFAVGICETMKPPPYIKQKAGLFSVQTIQ